MNIIVHKTNQGNKFKIPRTVHFHLHTSAGSMVMEKLYIFPKNEVLTLFS